MVASIAVPNITDFLSTSLFKTGNAPGSARQVGQVLVFWVWLKLVGHEQKSLVLVLSCVWTSRPITTSNISFLNLLTFYKTPCGFIESFIYKISDRSKPVNARACDRFDLIRRRDAAQGKYINGDFTHNFF